MVHSSLLDPVDWHGLDSGLTAVAPCALSNIEHLTHVVASCLWILAFVLFKLKRSRCVFPAHELWTQHELLPQRTFYMPAVWHSEAATGAKQVEGVAS